ncbi:uncharacterized protein LOC124378563 [Silurus meridionalis]|uniref:uncharacterized protein LOC124378563 n=1 Tax=Silurus meridionalis TaxID=175797 RepID=UPI001EEBBCC5|nr:uncharacterized protein LOC124378563 [Silurus meridionalis]
MLDAIGEVIIKDFTAAQLTNATFISKWFQIRLRLFLSSVSTDFLFSISSKTFSCETYQIVVEALGSQESLMTKKQKQWVFTSFIFPFLSRVDLPDPGCFSNTSGSNDWFEKNLGNFSNYATLKELQILNANFSSVAVLVYCPVSRKLSSFCSQMQECWEMTLCLERVKGLNNVYSNLSVTQSNTIFSYIQDYLKYQSSQGLSCYGSGSFYMFLKQLFLSFGFPDLNDFLSLIPADRQAEILSSISTEELSEYLKSTNPVINGSELCTLLNNYNRTTQYLEMEPVLSSALASRTLECVWPRA